MRSCVRKRAVCDMGIDRRIIFTWIPEKYGVRVAGSIHWSRDASSGRLLEHCIKRWEFLY
jgi:hypothetical protein